MQQQYITHLTLEGLSQNTIRDKRLCLIRLAAALDPVLLLDATHDMIYAWRASLTTGPQAVVNYMCAVRCYYDWAIQAGLHPGPSPADGIPVPRIGQRLPRPITEAALMEVLEAAPRRIRPWLVLAGWAGLRAQEIARLRCESVLLAADPPGILVTRETAKGLRERFVPLGDFPAGELAGRNLGRRGWAWTRRDGLPGPNTPSRVSELCNDHLHDCGFPDTLHSLRHRFLTQVQRLGKDLRVTQQLAGHRDPAQTALYTLVSGEGSLAVVQALPVPPRLRAAG
ncbi:MAG TPA: tyrosine-type recombinase/integrase [Streptosporangiaceae bacterium]|nr:tyrosine-type recombinase/integrase [Streptosporangiaceae bacterium]